jgi:hypothetical protein
VTDNESSGLWFEDAAGAPTLAEIETALAAIDQPFDIDAALAANPLPVASPFDPIAEPAWVDEVAAGRVTPKRMSRRKRLWHETAPNPCKCYSYAATGQIGPRAKRPEAAIDLCPCQVKLAFLRVYPEPITAELLRGMFLLGRLRDEFRDRPNWPRTDEQYPFELPTAEDLEHVAWIVDLNRDTWTAEAARQADMTPAANKSRFLRLGLTESDWDYWHGEQARARARQTHHTH